MRKVSKCQWCGKGLSGRQVPVPGYEGKYTIDDAGQVFSFISSKYLSARPDGNGYLLVTLSQPTLSVRIHRLLLSSFVRPAREGEVARHLDDENQHNCLSNLAWGSHKDNSADAWRNGRVKPASGSSTHNAVLSRQQARVACRLALRGRVGVRRVGRWFGVSHSIISRIKSGKNYGVDTMDIRRTERH